MDSVLKYFCIVHKVGVVFHTMEIQNAKIILKFDYWGHTVRIWPQESSGRYHKDTPYSSTQFPQEKTDISRGISRRCIISSSLVPKEKPL